MPTRHIVKSYDADIGMMIKMKGTLRYYSGWYMQSVEVATPHTWWRYTRNRQDAFEGFAMIDKIFTTKVKRTLPELNIDD